MSSKKYTVSSPPRVYELAIAMGITSEQARTLLYLDTHEIYRTPSHKVPLIVAMRMLGAYK